MSATGAVSILNATAPNPGPLARLAELTATPDIIETIAIRVLEGETLQKIAKAWEVPHGKLMLWIEADQKRSETYWAAVKHAAHLKAMEATDIADDAGPAEVPKARLQIAARQWNAERLYKERYAQRNEQTGAGGAPIEVSDPIELAKRMLFIMRKADLANEKVVAEIPAPAPAEVTEKPEEQEDPI